MCTTDHATEGGADHTAVSGIMVEILMSHTFECVATVTPTINYTVGCALSATGRGGNLMLEASD